MATMAIHYTRNKTIKSKSFESVEEAKNYVEGMFKEFSEFIQSEMAQPYPTCHSFNYEKVDNEKNYGYWIDVEINNFAGSSKEKHIISIL